ncbi:hypothetical protein OUZ56_029857 [Daphnia magna]|nr:hypothetical protein OUZ56_029857 [Daphnia magna]
MLSRQPDENENTGLIQRAVRDESPEDFSNIAAEKSNDGDGPGFSDEEEVCLTINNALANTTPKESFDLRGKNNTLKRPSSAISVYFSGRTTPAADSSLHSILNNISKRNSKTLRETKKTTKFKLCSTSETAGHARMMETRLRLLSAAMEVREKLKNPMTAAEIPKDLQDIIFDPYDNI